MPDIFLFQFFVTVHFPLTSSPSCQVQWVKNFLPDLMFGRTTQNTGLKKMVHPGISKNHGTGKINVKTVRSKMLPKQFICKYLYNIILSNV
jgi:hypothetical protein